MDTKLAILLTAAQTLNETAIATALLVKAVHAWDGSDETSGDGNDHSDNLSEPGNTADTTDETAHTEETNK